MTDQTQNLLPLPTPPPITEREVTFVPGKFDYIKSSITQTETWDFVKQDCESFMFSQDPKISIISEKMIELGYDGHSGCSFGCIMRDMQYIAKHGEKKFMETYLRNISNTNRQ